MLTQADIQVISTVFGKPVDEISSAISDNEKEVALDLRLNGKVYTPESIEELKETIRGAGVEIGFKQIAKNLGLEISSDEKDPEIIANKFKSQLEKSYEEKYKNQTPSDELLELKNKIEMAEAKYNKLNDTYQNSLKDLESQKENYNKLQQENSLKERNNRILSAFPEKMKFDKNDALLITVNNFEETENGIIDKRTNQVVTDPVGEPEKWDNIIKAFSEEKGWLGRSGMNGKDRGHNGSTTPKGMSDDQAYKYLTEKGIAPMSEEGSSLFLELTAKE